LERDREKGRELPNLGELPKQTTSLPTAAGVDFFVCLRDPFGHLLFGVCRVSPTLFILPNGDDVSGVNGLQLFKAEE
jgi:hypothetical protein